MQKNNLTVKDIVLTGMLIAINIVSIYIRIPYGTGAMVHLGTASLYAIAIIFGGKKGALTGGLGAFLFDIIGGASPYMLWSLVIKGLAGYTMGSISNFKGNSNIIKIIIGGISASILTLIGYLCAWTVIIGSIEAAVLNIPSSIVSSIVGMAIGIPLALALKKRLTFLN